MHICPGLEVMVTGPGISTVSLPTDIGDGAKTFARQGCRSGTRVECYQQPDDVTLRAVVEFLPPQLGAGPLKRATRGKATKVSRTLTHTCCKYGEARQRLSRCRASLPLLGSNQDSPDPESGVLPVTPRGSAALDCHGAEGDRTPDLCSAIAALSQLSYSPKMVPRGGNLVSGRGPVNELPHPPAPPLPLAGKL